MGRKRLHPDRAMTNAEKQKRYRRHLEEKRIQINNRVDRLNNEVRTLRYDNARLHAIIPEDDDYVDLKTENEKLKTENKQLRDHIRELRSKKKDRSTDVIERAQARSTSGAWTKE